MSTQFAATCGTSNLSKVSHAWCEAEEVTADNLEVKNEKLWIPIFQKKYYIVS